MYKNWNFFNIYGRYLILCLFIKKVISSLLITIVSLLPTFGKIFERIVFDNIYTYLDENNLLNQSRFRLKNSRVYQLMEITYNIFSWCDCNPTLEARTVFFDISKAFDKVWHKGLLFKLEPMGISGDFLILMESFLSEKFQKFLLNGQSSEWVSIKAGVP